MMERTRGKTRGDDRCQGVGGIRDGKMDRGEKKYQLQCCVEDKEREREGERA